MKTILVIFLLSFAAVAFCDQDWVYMIRDQKVGEFQLSTKGKLQYNGATFENFALDGKATKLAISPFSPDGKYAVLFSFGETPQCAILQIDKHSASGITMDGTPVVWYSWSTQGQYLLLSSYTDQDNNLYSVTLGSLQARKIPITLQKSGEKTELDTTTVTWIAPDTFEMEAFIHCASCDSREEDKVIRSYKLNVNVATMVVKTEEQAVKEEE